MFPALRQPLRGCAFAMNPALLQRLEPVVLPINVKVVSRLGTGGLEDGRFGGFLGFRCWFVGFG